MLEQEKKNTERQRYLEACDLLDQADFTRAEIIFRDLVTNDSTEPLYWNKLGSLLARTERLVEAKSCFEQALCLNPEQVASLTNLGNVYYQEGNLVKAENLQRQALSIQPDYVIARQNLAVILKQQNRYKELISLQKHGSTKGKRKLLGCLPVFVIGVGTIVIFYKSFIS